MDELDEIERLAKLQIEGGFPPESDALTALHMVVALAVAVKRLREEVGLA